MYFGNELILISLEYILVYTYHILRKRKSKNKCGLENKTELKPSGFNPVRENYPIFRELGGDLPVLIMNCNVPSCPVVESRVETSSMASSSLLESWLERLILGPHPRHAESETVEVRPSNL